MRGFPNFAPIAGIFAILGVAGCSAAGPYVYDSAEFNRRATGFGQPPKDITAVTVCYNTSGATPRDILALAEAECVKFNKTAAFVSQDRRTCPLLTPVAARFSCVLR